MNSSLEPDDLAIFGAQPQAADVPDLSVPALGTLSAWSKAAWTAACVAIGQQLPTLMIAIAYILFSQIMWDRLIQGTGRSHWISYSVALGFFAMVGFAFGAASGTWALWRSRYAGSLFALRPWVELARERVSLAQVFEAAILLALIPSFLNAFVALKVMLPLLHPFAFDTRLLALDRALHFGYLPSDLTHRLLPAPTGLHTISYLYHSVWHLLLVFAITACLWARTPQLRQQFFLSFVLCWSVLGTVMATLLSSVGPCYFKHVTGDGAPYARLVAALQQTQGDSPIGAVISQQSLWQAYTSGDYTIQAGISAMPSLHVAMAVLMTLLAWQVHRGLGLLAAGYAAFILFGSVHLGWHYAADGYFSIIGTSAIWWGAGKLVRWYNTSILNRAT